MNLALIGYGKMGKTIEALALENNYSIGIIIDNEQDWATKGHLLSSCDAAIEFSVPGMVAANLKKCFEAGVPVVTGTTGWYKQLVEVTDACVEQNGTLFYSSNFSIGVNIFFEINRRLASIMNQYPDYDVDMTEIHHTQKLDSPSGTAISLANDIIANTNRKDSWNNSETNLPEELRITSIREGSVPGIHEISWTSEIDKLSIRHEAFNRKGFAMGALLAAGFIAGKKGVYGMKDLMAF